MGHMLPSAFRRRTVFAAATAILIVLAAIVWWLLSGPSPTNYVTVPVTRATVARGVTATGTVNPVLTITVGTYVSGVIQKIDCDFNTHVTKGELCARIDPRPYQTIVDQDRAGLQTSRAQLQKDLAVLIYARESEGRYQALYTNSATSKELRDSAVNNYKQAIAQVSFDRASIAQHQASLEAAEVNLGYTNIISPVDGTVVSRNVTVGQTVAASFQTPTLFLIATDLTKMQVDTNVSESDIGGIKDGDRADFTVVAYPDRRFQGTVTQVRQAPQMVQNVVTYDAVVTVPNGQLLLKPGMTATVRIIVAEHKRVLRVPNAALRYVPGGVAARTSLSSASSAGVFVLRGGNPVRVPVVAGLDDGSYTEIMKGDLKLQDTVIVSERASATGGAQQSRPAFRF